MSANQAVRWLQELNFPKCISKPFSHAIEAHSYSAKITPLTTEAKIVQDADRLDTLGAVGLSRCLMLAGQWQVRCIMPKILWPNTETMTTKTTPSITYSLS